MHTHGDFLVLWSTSSTVCSRPKMTGAYDDQRKRSELSTEDLKENQTGLYIFQRRCMEIYKLNVIIIKKLQKQTNKQTKKDLGSKGVGIQDMISEIKNEFLTVIIHTTQLYDSTSRCHLKQKTGKICQKSTKNAIANLEVKSRKIMLDSGNLYVNTL